MVNAYEELYCNLLGNPISPPALQTGRDRLGNDRRRR